MNGVLGMAAAGIGVGAAAGADNFRAAAGLALVDAVSARSWVRALIVADAAGLVIGLAIGSVLPLLVADIAPVIGLAALAIIALIAIFGADELVERAVKSRSLAIAVPILLGVDNLVAGAALGSLGYPVWITAPLAIATSALLCVAGFVAGSSVLARKLVGSSTRVGGAVLAIAVAIAVANG